MKYIKQVCKIGQGADCCRYLGAGSSGFTCMKKTSLRGELDRRATLKLMHAQADNCPGEDPDINLENLPVTLTV